jgi:hypothetical protein
MTDVRRRNLLLGLLLGTAVLGMIALWFVVFTRSGLPKDPELWRKLHEGQAAPETGKKS